MKITKLRAKLTILLLIISMFLYGCGNESTTIENENTSDEATLTIYTTIFPLYDFAVKIGGEHVKVENVYPPNVDAHSFEPSAKTMANIASSDALIFSGAGIEGFIEAAAKVLENEKVKLVKAADGIELLAHEEHVDTEEEHGHEEATHSDEHADEEQTDEHTGQHEDNHGDIDPHVWLDPIYAITMAENIKNTLVELKPEAKDVFEQNFLTVKHELEKLDTEFSSVVNEASNKKILVAHAAYGYWEARYGIEQIAITGLSPTQEPSQKQLSTIIETAKANDLHYIIFEQNVTSKISDVVKKEIGAEVLYLNNLESITEEDLEKKEDYFSMMRKNLETLKTALN